MRRAGLTTDACSGDELLELPVNKTPSFMTM